MRLRTHKTTSQVLASICAALLAAPLHAQSPQVLPQVLEAPSWRLDAKTQAQLDEILDEGDAASARIGLGVRLLGRAASPSAFPSVPIAGVGARLFSRDENKKFMPASNIKMYTVASALKYLGADFRVSTRVLATGKRQGSTWLGDVYLVGGGDPMLSTGGLQVLARALHARGIREISGRIIGDGSALKAESFGGRFPEHWTLDDALWYYGPPISALAIDRNQIDISLAPTRLGRPAILTTNAPADFPIENRAVTLAPHSQSSIVLDRADKTSAISNTLSISGGLPLGEKYTEGVAIPDPPRRAAWIFKRALLSLGVQVRGDVESGKLQGKATELARRDSPPLSQMAAFCLKPSDNLSAEMLLRLTALHAGSGRRDSSASRAHSMMRGWLSTRSQWVSDARFVDGSGLARYNLISPRLTLDLLQSVESLPMPEARAFWNALPIAGVDGTIRRRMKNTRAARNVRAKTGSFSIASSLSGFVTTRDGFRLAVSFLSNFGDTGVMRDKQNAVFRALADSRLESQARSAPST